MTQQTWGAPPQQPQQQWGQPQAPQQQWGGGPAPAPAQGWGQPQAPAAPMPQVSNEDPDDFFSGGGDGVPSFKFTTKPGLAPGNVAEVGAEVFGTVVSQERQIQTVMGTTTPIYDEKGRPKEQLRVVLQTNLRGWDKCPKPPTGPDGNPLPPQADDGKRAVYVKGWMKGAVADAIRRASAPGLRPGGRLHVRLTELVPTQNGNPYPKYEASYEAPGAGDGMFAEANAAADAAQAQQAPQAAPAPQQQPQYGNVPMQAPQAAPAPQQAPQGGWATPDGTATTPPQGEPQYAPQPQPAPAPQQGAPAYDEPPF